MSSSPKIFVFKMREIIYTLLLLFLAVLLIICLFLMFRPKKEDGAASMQQTAGESGGQTQTGTDAQTQSAAGAQAQSGTNASATQDSGPGTQTQSAASTQAQSGTNAAATQDSGTDTQTQSGSEAAVETVSYTPGVYTSPVTLGGSAVDVEVTVDKDRIRSIRLVNLSETTAASFPLVSPSLDNIASQILETQKLEGITCPQENRYTSQLLLSAVADALALARTQQ